MQPLNQAEHYSSRSKDHRSFAARARSAADVGFHTDLADRYGRLAAEALVFGREDSETR